MKEWRLAEQAPEDFAKRFSEHDPLIIQLLYNRKFENPNALDLFFNPDFEKLHDPFLFQDMEKACRRVWRAIENKEKVLIHGDYDADGVTSAAILYKAFQAFGLETNVFIPHRENDGYGLNMKNAQKFIDQGINLLITVDCGITNIEEVELLNKNKVDVIITDHHEPLEKLPQSLAILDPKVTDDNYPFSGISGAGVAYKLVQALFTDSRIENYKKNLEDFGGAEGFQKWILDIVAIGIVADVSPLLDENRILVKWGLVVLEKTRNLGLKKLLEVISVKKISNQTIGFQIAPRLNAAGRMEHAGSAFELLITNDLEKAEQLANQLNQYNKERQRVTEQIVQQAKEQIDKDQTMHFAYHEEWTAGVVGLVAGKLCDELYRPVCVMTKVNGMIVGSGRSIEGFNITKSLSLAEENLARFGGHTQACGFTLRSDEHVSKFREIMLEQAEKELGKIDLNPFITIDAEVELKNVNLNLLEELDKFEPYGEANPKPLFLLKNLFVAALDYLGENNQHLRLMIKQAENPKLYKMLCFWGAEKWQDLAIGSRIDAVCELGINEWNGNREVELKIIDLKIK